MCQKMVTPTNVSTWILRFVHGSTIEVLNCSVGNSVRILGPSIPGHSCITTVIALTRCACIIILYEYSGNNYTDVRVSHLQALTLLVADSRTGNFCVQAPFLVFAQNLCRGVAQSMLRFLG